MNGTKGLYDVAFVQGLGTISHLALKLTELPANVSKRYKTSSTMVLFPAKKTLPCRKLSVEKLEKQN